MISANDIGLSLGHLVSTDFRYYQTFHWEVTKVAIGRTYSKNKW